MPTIDFAKEWERIKKGGASGLVVALLWAIVTIKNEFGPKDQSCVDDVKYMRSLNEQNRATIENLTNQLMRSVTKQADPTILRADSVFKEKVRPIIKK